MKPITMLEDLIGAEYDEHNWLMFQNNMSYVHMASYDLTSIAMDVANG